MSTIIDDIRDAYTRSSDASEQQGLRERLAESARAAGLLDIAFRTVDSPFGTLLLAATDEGLVRLAFELEDHELVLAHLAAAVSPRILRAPARLDAAAEQLDQYFDGRRRSFDVALDLRLAHGFRRTVLDHLQAIPYGTTQSYAQVAAGAGNPTAVRAAAGACSHNPVPLIVPCHRVIRSDGAIGNYLGGAEVKQALLTFEAAA